MSTITHEGIITRITDNKIVIRIEVKSACASCQIKSACNLAETESKFIEVNHRNESFSVGEKVWVKMSESQGWIAVFWAYVIPLILLLLGLMIFQNAGIKESLSALYTLIILAVYYFVLYLNRKYFARKFHYKVYKMQ